MRHRANPSPLLATLLGAALLLLLGADRGQRVRNLPVVSETASRFSSSASRRVDIQRLRIASRVSLDDPSRGLPALMALHHEALHEDVRMRAGVLVLDGITRHPTAEVEGLDDTLRSLWLEQESASDRQRSLLLLLARDPEGLPSGHRGRFLATVLPSVLDSARRHELPPSVALAQAIHESGWGRSKLATDHRNLFGIKAGRSRGGVLMPTTEHRDGAETPVRSRFRSFPALGDSIEHHAQLLGTDRRYAAARAESDDWRAFLEQIAPRYATDPRYAQRVGAIVERYRLDRWDGLVRDAVDQDRARADDPS